MRRRDVCAPELLCSSLASYSALYSMPRRWTPYTSYQGKRMNDVGMKAVDGRHQRHAGEVFYRAHTRMVAAISEPAFKGGPGDTVQDDALLSWMQCM